MLSSGIASSRFSISMNSAWLAFDLNTNPDTPYTYYDLIDEGGYCESDGYMYTDIDRIKKHFSGEKSQKMLRTISRFSKRTFS